MIAAALFHRRLAIAPAILLAALLAGCQTAAPPTVIDDADTTTTVASGTPGGKTAWAPIKLRTRGCWRVTQLASGIYRAVAVLDTADPTVIAVAECSEPRDWEAWVNDGFPDADRRVSLVLGPDHEVRQSFVYGADSILDGGAKGVRVGPPAADSGTSLRTYDDLIQGIEIAAGQGAFPAVPLPENFRSASYDTWLGVMGSKKELKDEGAPASIGWSLFAVGALSAADEAGLEPGDVIISISPLARDTPAIGDFYVAVAHRFRVGDTITIEWLHQLDDAEIELRDATVTIPAYPIDRHGVAAPDARWEAAARSPEAALLEKLAARHGYSADLADFTARLRDLNRGMDPYRLPAVTVAHQWPFATEPMMRATSTRIRSAAAAGPEPLLAALGEDLALAPVALAAELPAYAGTDLNGHLDYLEAIVKAAAAQHEKAFAALSAEDRQFVERAAEGYMEAFVQAHMMIYAELPQQRESIRVLQLGGQVDLAALLQQARLMALAAAPDFLASLRAEMEKKSKPGQIARRATDFGPIVLYGTGDDRHRQDAAILIDLGGDDVYINNTGSSVPGKIPSALLVDFAGNDRYENWRLGAQGSGLLGVGLLVDQAGDDIYIARRGGQGFGHFGVGLLVDRAGDDIFRAMDYAQGVGQFGVGVLMLDGGRNRVEGHTACQGVGFPSGIGLLLGGSDDDQYYCKGQYASGYRDPGSFEGWGQGLGTGHRPYASGGLGMLIDRGGADHYEGGSFAGGGGYYFGLGMLHDISGDDQYRGSRYNAGFTAHQAVGVFLEDAGDDRYWQLHHVGQGMSWDESVTVFVDAAGDDLYDCPGFGFGAAAMTGFTLFKDLSGSDIYRGQRPGNVHGNSYHGGTSIGYFLDLGPGTDEMAKARQDTVIAVDQDVTYFVHAPDFAAANRAADEPLTESPAAPE